MFILIIVFINIFFETFEIFENILPLVYSLFNLIFYWNFIMTMFIDAIDAKIFLPFTVLAVFLIAVVDLNIIWATIALDFVGRIPLLYPLFVF
jgi:hypothetical protein